MLPNECTPAHGYYDHPSGVYCQGCQVEFDVASIAEDLREAGFRVVPAVATDEMVERARQAFWEEFHAAVPRDADQQEWVSGVEEAVEAVVHAVLDGSECRMTAAEGPQKESAL